MPDEKPAAAEKPAADTYDVSCSACPQKWSYSGEAPPKNWKHTDGKPATEGGPAGCTGTLTATKRPK